MCELSWPIRRTAARLNHNANRTGFWEQSDYESRCEAAKKGKVRSRTVPTSKDYPGKYRGYWMVDNKPNSLVSPTRPWSVKLDYKPKLPAKSWKGCPSAMILKCSYGMSRPVFPNEHSKDKYPPSELGTPMDTRI
ncbi:hypothetical protein V8E54_004962 [Elaphomyces granulatus]